MSGGVWRRPGAMVRLGSVLAHFVRALTDLALPSACAGCGASGSPGCAACLAVLGTPASPALPSPTPAGLPLPFAIAAYDGVVRSLLLAYKERGERVLARPLGAALAEATVAAVRHHRGAVLLVPVPSTPRARRERGFDPVRELARVAVREVRASRWPVSVLPALRHRRAVRDSAGLAAGDRARNLAGALAVAPRGAILLAGRDVVLLDDLVTTGATLAEAARAVRDAGGRVRTAAVVAATRRRV